jgi:anti-sigma factor RsiW
MTCRELVDAVADYVGGEVSEEARAEIDAHRAGCRECAAYFESYVTTVALGRVACRGDDLSLPESAVRAILAARKKGR